MVWASKKEGQMYRYLLRAQVYSELPDIPGVIGDIKKKFGPVQEELVEGPNVGKLLITTHKIPAFFERAYRLEPVSDSAS